MGKLIIDGRLIAICYCNKHPKYTGKFAPRVPCEDCWRHYIKAQDYLKWEGEMSYEEQGR